MTENPVYKKKDFVSDQEVRWCPGCGDYAILSSIQLAMTKIGKKKEDIVFVSGIGCSSRFPYYMNTFGMHTIHGRATAIASGLKTHNPNLSVWVMTGDGDALSIGGNHFIHTIRRNTDVNVVIFNNEIYGLTKGQYSPTTKLGHVTKSTPFGAVDNPFVPGAVALGAGATFYARTLDTDPKHMQEVFLAASKHKGTSVVEVLQNCVIFNDKVHQDFTNRETREERTMRLEHGKPMIFGAEKNKGIRLNGLTPEVVTIGENGVKEEDLLVHDAHNMDDTLAHMLTRFDTSRMPLPLGVFREVNAPVYEDLVHAQINDQTEKKGRGKVADLISSGETWEVK